MESHFEELQSVENEFALIDEDLNEYKNYRSDVDLDDLILEESIHTLKNGAREIRDTIQHDSIVNSKDVVKVSLPKSLSTKAHLQGLQSFEDIFYE